MNNMPPRLRGTGSQMSAGAASFTPQNHGNGFDQRRSAPSANASWREHYGDSSGHLSTNRSRTVSLGRDEQQHDIQRSVTNEELEILHQMSYEREGSARDSHNMHRLSDNLAKDSRRSFVDRSQSPHDKHGSFAESEYYNDHFSTSAGSPPFSPAASSYTGHGIASNYMQPYQSQLEGHGISSNLGFLPEESSTHQRQHRYTTLYKITKKMFGTQEK